jgi:hypothetical protein
MLALSGPAWGQTPDRIKGGVEQPPGLTDRTPWTQPDSSTAGPARDQEILRGQGKSKDKDQPRNSLKKPLEKKGIKAKPLASFKTLKNYFNLNETSEDQAFNTSWWKRLWRDSMPAWTPSSKLPPDNLMQGFFLEKQPLQGGEAGAPGPENFIQEFYRERLAAEPQEEEKEEPLKERTKLFNRNQPGLEMGNEDLDKNEDEPLLKKEKKLFGQDPPESKPEEEEDQ